MQSHFDALLQKVVLHEHAVTDIIGLEDFTSDLTSIAKGFMGSVDASAGTLGVPLAPPSATVSGWWIITKGGYILIAGVSTLFETGDMVVYTLSTTTYSRVDAKLNDAQLDITSTFSKLLTGLATQKLVNEHLDKLITTSASAPAVTDDTAHGYFVGCIWIKSGTDIYQAADVSSGAAVWKQISLTGSEAKAYRDFTDQSSIPASPDAGVHRSYIDASGQVCLKDSSGNIVMLRQSLVNNIGVPGHLGFGVGICPPDILATYNAANTTAQLLPLYGTFDINSANYGNYICSLDASIMVWLPFAWVKRNPWDVKPKDYFATEAAANTAGYMTPRCMINAGVVLKGVFVDKYKPSLTGITAADLDASGSLANKGILSSIQGGNPISSSSDTKRKLVTGSDNLYAGSFANCRTNGQSPSDISAGGIDAVKSRGSNYFAMSVFIRAYIFDLVMAHQAGASGNTLAAWNAVSPYFPKGNNNYGADYNDAGVTFPACTDAYWGAKPTTMEARKNGGGTPFSRTTHNGQESGVSDINGNQYELMTGLTCIAEAGNSVVSITRAAEAVVTITNAAAARANYANGSPIMITGTAAAEWNTLLQSKIFTISDLAGNTFKIKNKAGAYVSSAALSADYTTGFTSTTGKFYVLKESVDMKSITSGNSLATDHWGATGVAAMYDEIAPDLCGDIGSRMGSGTNIVFSSETNRALNDYKVGSCLLCKSKLSYDISGLAAYGNDYYYIYIVNDLAPLAFSNWSDGTNAGVGASNLYGIRASSYAIVSVRGCLCLS